MGRGGRVPRPFHAVVTSLRSREPRTWRVVARLEVESQDGERLILEPPTTLTYLDRTSHRDFWNTREVSWLRHVFALADGRQVHLMENWDENDEGVMVRTLAFPPVGLEPLTEDWDDD